MPSVTPRRMTDRSPSRDPRLDALLQRLSTGSLNPIEQRDIAHLLLMQESRIVHLERLLQMAAELEKDRSTS
jgi:hypothetical protein